MVRNAQLFHELTQAWYKFPYNPKARPKRLLYPIDYFPYPNSKAQVIMEKFVCQMEKFLQVTRETVCLATLWDDNDPSGSGATLNNYLQNVRLPSARAMNI